MGRGSDDTAALLQPVGSRAAAERVSERIDDESVRERVLHTDLGAKLHSVDELPAMVIPEGVARTVGGIELVGPARVWLHRGELRPRRKGSEPQPSITLGAGGFIHTGGEKVEIHEDQRAEVWVGESGAVESVCDHPAIRVWTLAETTPGLPEDELAQEMWMRAGRLHRERDQPAIITPVSREWYEHGVPHRDPERGPAVIAEGGHLESWDHGVFVGGRQGRRSWTG